MQRCHGKTLLEVLLTAGVAGVVLGLGIPAMQHFMQNQKMNAWMAGVHGMLYFAREQAVVRRQRVVVCASHSGKSCDGGMAWERGMMAFVDLNADRKRQDNEPVLRVWRMDATGLQVHTSSGRKTIRYLPNGTSLGSNARITVCDERGPAWARALVIGNTGRIRRERADQGREIRCQ